MPIGGGKGGADFDPGRPQRRRDHAVLPELHDRAVPATFGEYTDVPAGDIGVGAREIGFLFGQYKRITNRYESGVLTGKGITWGGALVRTEATGYGATFFAEEMLKVCGTSLDGRTWSPDRQRRLYGDREARSAGRHGGGLLGPEGYVVDKSGLDLELLKEIKLNAWGRVSEYTQQHPDAQFVHRRQHLGRPARRRACAPPRTSSPAPTRPP